jgi:hypothetical protein
MRLEDGVGLLIVVTLLGSFGVFVVFVSVFKGG